MWFVKKDDTYLHIYITGRVVWVSVTMLATHFYSYMDARRAAEQHGGVPYQESN